MASKAQLTTSSLELDPQVLTIQLVQVQETEELPIGELIVELVAVTTVKGSSTALKVLRPSASSLTTGWVEATKLKVRIPPVSTAGAETSEATVVLTVRGPKGTTDPGDGWFAGPQQPVSHQDGGSKQESHLKPVRS